MAVIQYVKHDMEMHCRSIISVSCRLLKETYIFEMLARNKKSKKNVIDVDLKSKIISDADKGMRTNLLSQKYGLPASTISSIKKNKENIISAVKSGFNCKRQRLRKPHFEQLEKDLNVWFLRCREHNYPISRSIIKAKAEQLHQASADTSKPFTASNGWITRFVRRQQVCLIFNKQFMCDALHI